MNIPIIVHMSTFNNSLIEETFQENIKLIYTFRDPLFILETYSRTLIGLQMIQENLRQKYHLKLLIYLGMHMVGKKNI